MQSVLDPPLLSEVAERLRSSQEADEVEEAPKRVVVAVPRPLTAEVRKRVGLPVAKIPPYRFGYVALLLVLAGAPMLLIGWFKATFALAFVSLAVLPAVRFYEKREHQLRERVYTHGKEVVGRVLDVEPGGPDRNGKIVRLEFQLGETRIAASIFGCPFARKGLEPGDDVVVYYAPDEPHRCVIAERIARKTKARKVGAPPEQGDDGCGGCGPGGCGGGGCGGGGCGGGGCGGGGW
ncbi:MAG: hypothetical protein HYV09_32220, partial [Deltaproteobacteria bacterium]|nr:hypothetical protein [Deltaproteobacteria bacterium]